MGSTQSQKLPTSKVPGGSASDAARGSDFLSGSPLTDLPTPPSPPARSLLATPSGNIMRDGLAGGGLKLSAPVGPGASNRPRDVFQVETVLNGSGLLSRAPGTRFGDDTASAIGQGQARLNRDHGNTVGRRPLKIDSLINPDGPTQSATRGLARQVADQWRGFEQRRKPALPSPSVPKPGFLNPVRASVTPVVENTFTADIKRLQDSLTADQAAELTRLADGLSKTRVPGAVAGDISEAINTDGLKAVAEFQVVRDRLAKIGTPDQVRALDFAVMQRLDPAGQKLLRGSMGSKSGGRDGSAGEVVGTLVELLPGIGNIASGVSAVNSGKASVDALRRGDFNDAAGEAGSTVLDGVGAVPIVGNIAKGVVKGGKLVWKLIGTGVSPGLKAKGLKLATGHIQRFPGSIHNAIKNSGLKDPVITGGKRNTVNIDSKGTLENANQTFDAMTRKLGLDPTKAKPLTGNPDGREIKFGDGLTIQVRPKSGSPAGNNPTIEFGFGKENSNKFNGKSSIKIRFKGEGS